MVCRPQWDVFAVEIGTETAEKLPVLVEMRGYSVLRCKPCGQFLPVQIRRRMGRNLADEIMLLERNDSKRVKHGNVPG